MAVTLNKPFGNRSMVSILYTAELKSKPEYVISIISPTLHLYNSGVAWNDI